MSVQPSSRSLAGSRVPKSLSVLRIALVDPNEYSEPLIESIIEADDAVMERYFEGHLPTDQELSGLIVQAVASETLVPVLCRSTKTGVGFSELLDGLVVERIDLKAVRSEDFTEFGIRFK